MTEAEWLACDDWRPMLAFVSGRWTQRKAMLYVCAGLRSIWELLYDEASQDAVEVVERAADGVASPSDMESAAYYAESPTFGYDFDAESVRTWNRNEPGVRRLIQMGVYTFDDLPAEGLLGDEVTRSRLFNAAHIAYHALYEINDGQLNEHLLEHLSNQKEWPRGWLVREMIGNVIQTVSISTAWLSWNDAAVVRLAQTIYDNRILPTGTFDNTRLLILADALEEAGCTGEQILTHLRDGGEHYRGCWVIDLLLGKQ